MLTMEYFDSNGQSILNTSRNRIRAQKNPPKQARVPYQPEINPGRGGSPLHPQSNTGRDWGREATEATTKKEGFLRCRRVGVWLVGVLRCARRLGEAAGSAARGSGASEAEGDAVRSKQSYAPAPALRSTAGRARPGLMHLAWPVRGRTSIGHTAARRPFE